MITVVVRKISVSYISFEGFHATDNVEKYLRPNHFSLNVLQDA